ncbi:Protein mak16 [Cucumispora dikerogammari]|nr:Protein mak16 [Cucumispora dikerogammari]
MIPRDEQIWSTIGNNKHCSFKIKLPICATVTNPAKPQNTLITALETPIISHLCKNPYNVNGLCNKSSCPLANSKYATVRENSGLLYLYIKEPERILNPKLLYEEILLENDYNEGLEQIEKNLMYWPGDVVEKCKMKYTKLFKYLVRKSEAQDMNIIPNKMQRVNKRRRKIEKVAAKQALNIVSIQKPIELQLIERLKSGMYGKTVEEEVRNKDVIEKMRNTKRRFIAEFEESEHFIDNNIKTQSKNSQVKKKKKLLKESIIW